MDEEQERRNVLDWETEGHARDHVEAATASRWLFNEDNVDKVLLAAA